jgi:hypothetical protein
LQISSWDAEGNLSPEIKNVQFLSIADVMTEINQKIEMENNTLIALLRIGVEDFKSNGSGGHQIGGPVVEEEKKKRVCTVCISY